MRTLSTRTNNKKRDGRDDVHKSERKILLEHENPGYIPAWTRRSYQTATWVRV